MGQRPLRPGDVHVGGEGRPAPSIPFAVPDVEDVQGFFTPPPAGSAAVAVWITPTGRGEVPAFDAEARDRLKGLGYLR